ncbi:Immunoglobulin-like and fibronectin type III domain-containing protein 1 [Bienertia sinuspersici]
MAGGVRRSMINGGSESQRSNSPGRPIPKRGQVKGRIVKGLANSVVAMFSNGASPNHG